MPRKSGGTKGGISWIKKEEPKFIRQFKERIAYKEQASVETKVGIILIKSFFFYKSILKFD